MALMITEDCICCDVCVAECPNDAIAAGEDIFVIDGDRCTECVGHYESSRCVDACPVDAVVPDPQRVESREVLLAKIAA